MSNKIAPNDLYHLAWSTSHAVDALRAIAQQSGLVTEADLDSHDITKRAPLLPPQGWEWWLGSAAEQLELELQPVRPKYSEIEQVLRWGGPALLRLPARDSTDEVRLIAVLSQVGKQVPVIGADHQKHLVPVQTVRDLLCAPYEEPLRAEIEPVVAHIAPKRQDKVRRTLLTKQLAQTELDGGWLLHLLPSAGLWRQIRQARIIQPFGQLVIFQLIYYVLQTTAWAMIGYISLNHHLNWGWLTVWALLLLTVIPFHTSLILLSGQLTTNATGLFRGVFLHSALNLRPEQTRRAGVGEFLSYVLDIEAVELLALNGGLRTIVALVQMMVAVGILSFAPAGAGLVALLSAWLLIVALIGVIYFRVQYRWNKVQNQLTNDLVERMVGYRTRLAQENPETWHDEEDSLLNRYLLQTIGLDRVQVWLSELVPMGWMVTGIGGVMLWVVTTPMSVTELALGLGSVVLTFQVLKRLVDGLSYLLDVLVLWEDMSPIFSNLREHKATKTKGDISVAPSLERPISPDLVPIIEADNLLFQHEKSRLPTLDRCSLQIYHGDRLLLVGPSGSGKSTLVSILAGLRVPDGGLLLLHGYDRHTIGVSAWQRAVVLAPQFHENHILTGTFAFNLLLGRGWPPTQADLVEAEQICYELGLGDLLARMPAGMQQMVGNGGWRLSHGEQSRVFIARALLQSAHLIILDESFATLDPDNFAQSLACVIERAPALLVIAHL